MISVIIPLYNKAPQVGQTLQSVLTQSYTDFEVIVVDDGSTDQGLDVVRGFSDARLQVISQPNGGVSSARNAGIKAARGEYLAFLDADDAWHSDYLAHQIALAEKYPACSVFACRYAMRYADGSVHKAIIRKLRFEGADGILDNYFEVASCSHPPIWSSSVMVRKKSMEAIGGFPLGITSGEDLLTWARLACIAEVAYNQEYLGAFFNIKNESLAEPPTRIPARNDIVGQQLRVLYKQTPHAVKLRTYLSHWHKMRCSIFMRLAMRRSCIREALKALKYNILNYKVAIYVILVMLPETIRTRMLK